MSIGINSERFIEYTERMIAPVALWMLSNGLSGKIKAKLPPIKIYDLPNLYMGFELLWVN